MVISCLDVYVILGCQLPIKLPLQAAMRGMTLAKMSVISTKNHSHTECTIFQLVSDPLGNYEKL